MASLTKFWRALTLSVCLYSLLLWFYVVLRIVFSHVNLYSRFIDFVPFFNFLNLGILSFLLSFAACVIYLTFWER